MLTIIICLSFISKSLWSKQSIGDPGKKLVNPQRPCSLTPLIPTSVLAYDDVKRSRSKPNIKKQQHKNMLKRKPQFSGLPSPFSPHSRDSPFKGPHFRRDILHTSRLLHLFSGSIPIPLPYPAPNPLPPAASKSTTHKASLFVRQGAAPIHPLPS